MYKEQTADRRHVDIRREGAKNNTDIQITNDEERQTKDR